MNVCLFNIFDELMELFLAAAWERRERNHADQGGQYKGFKILELEHVGKGDRKPRTGYDFCPVRCNHYLRGKEFWFGSVWLVQLFYSCLSAGSF